MKKATKRIGIVLLSVAIIVCSIAFFSFRKNVKPVVYTYCDALISSLGVECINSSAADVVALYEYADFINVQKNGDIIESLTANTPLINGFTRSLALRCERALSALGVQTIEIPIGAFTNSVLLSNKGPKVSLDITFFSSVNCDFLSSFESVGVNQTRHAVYVKIDVLFNTVLPIAEHEMKLTNHILIAENILVGQIPNVYVNGEDATNYLDLVP